MKRLTTLAAALLLFTTGCALKDAVEDVQETAALKDVTVTTDTVLFDLSLPSISDSVAYHNPANYKITITHRMKADNTKEGSKDASFKGASLKYKVVADNAKDVALTNDGFSVPAGDSITFDTEETIDAESHRITCLYVFTQMGAGGKIDGDVTGTANIEIGNLKDEISLPSKTLSIQTNAPEDTKLFLNNAIAKGIFDEK